MFSRTVLYHFPVTLSCLALGACLGTEENKPAVSNSHQAAAKLCPLDAEPVQIKGEIAGGTQKQYFLVPVEIPRGTQRLEFLYGWADLTTSPTTGIDPNDTTVLDLGWWDQRGYRSADGFRGWGGSRQARLEEGTPGFIEAAVADRGFTPGPIQPGIWYAEFGAPITSRGGAEYTLQVQCLSQAHAGNKAHVPDPVDPNHVANDHAGWYHADFHMHGYHSNPAAPDAVGMAEQARDALLDVIFYTDYVVVAHWDEIGVAQRANPDLLYFPGREIITYSGHANTLGETRGVVEYRHGFEDITMRKIQAEALAAGGLFQINHPTTFDIPGLENLCRGCQWDLDEEVDWSQVHSMEVVTGPVITTSSQLGVGGIPLAIQNPFMRPAIDYWHEKLQQGFRITAVSGSDSKGTEAPDARNNSGYGSSATAIYGTKLSQQAIRSAIVNGNAFVKTLGADESPHVLQSAEDSQGNSVGYGGQLILGEDDQASLKLDISAAAGQRLTLYRNGAIQQTRLISSDSESVVITIARDPATEGPLGTWWAYELSSSQLLFDNILVAGEVVTTIGNPVFLTAAAN